MGKIILLNGPKGCGKTESVKFLQEHVSRLVNVNFKDKLHTLTREFFCLDEQTYWEIYNVRQLKENPHCSFEISAEAYNDLMDAIHKDKASLFYVSNGYKMLLSIRQAMIFVSECVCKPALGNDYFGKALVDNILSSDYDLFVEDSTAFAEELNPVIDYFGQENLMLIRIHGRGDFEGDSRSYIPDGVIENTVDIVNNSTEIAFLEKVYYHSSRFLLK